MKIIMIVRMNIGHDVTNIVCTGDMNRASQETRVVVMHVLKMKNLMVY